MDQLMKTLSKKASWYKFITLVSLFTLLSINKSFSQLTENFSDGDFTNNPAWVGEDVDFEIDNGALRLNAPSVAEESYLSTKNTLIGETEWNFYCELDFNPSGSNLTRIYLVSTDSILTNTLNGYYVQIGGSDDEVSLYRQTGTSKTEIIDGLDERVNMSNVTVRVKVTRDPTGNWNLLGRQYWRK